MAVSTEMKPSRVREVPPPLNAPRSATPPPPPTPPKPVVAAPLPKWRRGFRAAVPWLLAILLICLVIQVFLAGMGLLGGGDIQTHKDFVHVFEFVPLLIALAGFLGADKGAGWGGVAMMVMMEAQYFLIKAPYLILHAIHPVNGMAIFGVTLVLALNRPLWTPTPKPTAVATR